MIVPNLYTIAFILNIFIQTITSFTELNGFVHKIKLYMFENIFILKWKGKGGGLWGTFKPRIFLNCHFDKGVKIIILTIIVIFLLNLDFQVMYNSKGIFSTFEKVKV